MMMNTFILVIIGIFLQIGLSRSTGIYDECFYSRDCQDLKDIGFNTSGVYHITPDGTYRGFDVYCDMVTDGGGWVVFQRREDGSVNFYREWRDYQSGFGNITGEHWLGNRALHVITLQGFYGLRVDLEDWEGNKAFAKYGVFRVQSPNELYRLVIGAYTGDAGDSLDCHNGMEFSTLDRDNDANETDNCSAILKGGYWYCNCHRSNLNGLYLNGSYSGQAEGIEWMTWKGDRYSLKKTSMKIRRL